MISPWFRHENQSADRATSYKKKKKKKNRYKQKRQKCDFWTKTQKCPKTLRKCFLAIFLEFWANKSFLKFWQKIFPEDPKFCAKKNPFFLEKKLIFDTSISQPAISSRMCFLTREYTLYTYNSLSENRMSKKYLEKRSQSFTFFNFSEVGKKVFVFCPKMVDFGSFFGRSIFGTFLAPQNEISTKTYTNWLFAFLVQKWF